MKKSPRIVRRIREAIAVIKTILDELEKLLKRLAALIVSCIGLYAIVRTKIEEVPAGEKPETTRGALIDQAKQAGPISAARSPSMDHKAGRDN